MLVYAFGVLFVAMSLAYSYGLTMLDVAVAIAHLHLTSSPFDLPRASWPVFPATPLPIWLGAIL